MTEIAPVDLKLFCPNCGAQHIDEPQPEKGWTNPPHRSHECQFCTGADGKPFTWRPSDDYTNGVREIKTKGKRDSDPMPRLTASAIASLIEEGEIEKSALYADDGYINGIGFAIGRIAELAGIDPDLRKKGESA